MSKLILVLDVAPDIDQDDLITDVNCEFLVRMEEDDKTIAGWQWIREEEMHVVRGYALVEL